MGPAALEHVHDKKIERILTRGVASQITPSKLLLRANLTASLIDVHRLSSSWNSGLLAIEIVGVIVGLDNKGEPDLLCGDDETVPDSELVVDETGRPSADEAEADPCFGEGSDSGSMGSLRF